MTFELAVTPNFVRLVESVLNALQTPHIAVLCGMLGVLVIVSYFDRSK